MKGEITFFSNQEFGVIRAVEIDGEPWFVGKDVAERLGYERATKAIQDHVDNEDKDEVPIQDSIGRMQKTPIINESGLYSLILSSKLPRAKAFKRWVTSEVIPSIRKHGAYMTLETAEQMLSNPDFMIRLLQELKSEQEQRRELERQKKEDAPKVLFADAVKTSRTSRQTSGTSSHRIHCIAARAKLLTTASKNPACANPSVRTRVPGAVTLTTRPVTAAANAGQSQKLRRRTVRKTAAKRSNRFSSPTT